MSLIFSENFPNPIPLSAMTRLMWLSFSASSIVIFLLKLLSFSAFC